MFSQLTELVFVFFFSLQENKNQRQRISIAFYLVEDKNVAFV